MQPTTNTKGKDKTSNSQTGNKRGKEKKEKEKKKTILNPKLPTKTRHNYNLYGKQLTELHQPPPNLLHLHARLPHT